MVQSDHRLHDATSCVGEVDRHGAYNIEYIQRKRQLREFSAILMFNKKCAMSVAEYNATN